MQNDTKEYLVIDINCLYSKSKVYQCHEICNVRKNNTVKIIGTTENERVVEFSNGAICVVLKENLKEKDDE